MLDSLPKVDLGVGVVDVENSIELGDSPKQKPKDSVKGTGIGVVDIENEMKQSPPKMKLKVPTQVG